jgi:hypothetical protein
MARGRFLRETLFPLLERRLTPVLDQKAYDAVQTMSARYGLGAGSPPEPPAAKPAPAARLDAEPPRAATPPPPSPPLDPQAGPAAP